MKYITTHFETTIENTIELMVKNTDNIIDRVILDKLTDITESSYILTHFDKPFCQKYTYCNIPFEKDGEVKIYEEENYNDFIWALSLTMRADGICNAEKIPQYYEWSFKLNINQYSVYVEIENEKGSDYKVKTEIKKRDTEKCIVEFESDEIKKLKKLGFKKVKDILK
jgi:hypothetical protein